MKLTKESIQSGHLFLIDKPLGWSSFQVVNKIRWLLRKNFGLKKIKVGHAGTLDPLATGLLIICCGKKTKEISLYQAQKKGYTGTLILGATTPSYDLETEIEERFPVDHIDSSALQVARKNMEGEIEQAPPVFSALKKDGKRLYDYARAGETVEIPKRKITIHAFSIESQRFPEIDFEVDCSKGTYIRSLAHDFGVSLQSGAHLSALRRTKIGNFDVENALSIDQLTKIIEQNGTQNPKSSIN